MASECRNEGFRARVNLMGSISSEASTYVKNVIHHPRNENTASRDTKCSERTPILVLSDGSDPHANELQESFEALSLTDNEKRYGGVGCNGIECVGSGLDPASWHKATHIPELDSMNAHQLTRRKDRGIFSWANQPGRDIKKEHRDQDAELLSERTTSLTMASTLKSEDGPRTEGSSDIEETFEETLQETLQGPTTHPKCVTTFLPRIIPGSDDAYNRDKVLRFERATSYTMLASLRTEGNSDPDPAVTDPQPTATDLVPTVTHPKPTITGPEPTRKPQTALPKWAFETQAAAGQGHTSESHSSNFHKESSSKKAGPLGDSRKRKHQSRKYNEEDDQDEEDNEDRSPESSDKKGKTENSAQHWACPFAKRDPWKHQECLHAKLVKISYVKQHLNRVHCAPTHCPRCGQEFPNENSASELKNHLRAGTCEVREFSLDGKMTPETRLKVMDAKGRKDANGRNLNDAQRWYRMWDTLFPDNKRPQSPYAESPAVEILQAFSASMRRDIGSQVLGQVHDRGFPIDDRIELIEDIVSAFVTHLKENTPSPGSTDISPSITYRSTPPNKSNTDASPAWRSRSTDSFSSLGSALTTSSYSAPGTSTSGFSLSSLPTSGMTGSSNEVRSLSSCGSSSSPSVEIKLSPADQDPPSQEPSLFEEVPSPRDSKFWEATDNGHYLGFTSYGGGMKCASPGPLDFYPSRVSYGSTYYPSSIRNATPDADWLMGTPTASQATFMNTHILGGSAGPSGPQPTTVSYDSSLYPSPTENSTPDTSCSMDTPTASQAHSHTHTPCGFVIPILPYPAIDPQDLQDL